ncbi:MAG TPA: hypothetical protein VHM24_09970 [Gemmatimonadaceae bacterium]|nr:hypothetical protein [Gemmatimonadaceae bacterium]
MAWPLHEWHAFRRAECQMAAADRLEQDLEDMVTTKSRLVAAAGVLVLAACGGKDAAMNADLKKDLELASTASAITLPKSEPAAQVVSAIERTQPPARRVAQSQRAPKHRAAPRARPAPVEAENSELSTEVEPQPVEPSPAPLQTAPLPSQRPQPVASSGGGSGDGRIGTGRGDIGAGIGTIIGVVLRGGGVDGDECDPRTDGRRGNGGTISINNRIPVIGTFPGSGRIGTAATVGGMILGGRAGGRTRF